MKDNKTRKRKYGSTTSKLSTLVNDQHNDSKLLGNRANKEWSLANRFYWAGLFDILEMTNIGRPLVVHKPNSTLFKDQEFQNFQ